MNGEDHRDVLESPDAGVGVPMVAHQGAAFDLWLEAGHYASRPPGEAHGPFKTDEGCVVLEVSFPGRTGPKTGSAAGPVRED